MGNHGTFPLENSSSAEIPAPLQLTLGERLRHLRRTSRLTLQQVADELGVSKPTVWSWENDRAKPRLDRLDAMAKVFRLSRDELVAAVLEARPKAAPDLREPDDAMRATYIAAARELVAMVHNTKASAVRIMIEL